MRRKKQTSISRERIDVAPVLKARLTPGGMRRNVSDEAEHAARLAGPHIDARGRRVFVLYKRGKLTRQAARRENRSVGIWLRVRSEVHDLICTQSENYAAVRKILATKEFKATQKAVGYLIAGAIAIQVGLSAVVVFPFVALALSAFLSVSKNAYCRQSRTRKKAKKSE